ncbi:MAG: bifunctional 4-hydroxy-2-oxoglutarate aldolase/2-dehydro-3-deoxy-phosphogluconate aldolase [Mycetocola sp.]
MSTPDNTTLCERVFGQARVMAILRNMEPEHAVTLAERAWDLGISAVEVPIQQDRYIPSLAAVVQAGRARGHGVGAGTVTRLEQVDVAAELGCTFTVAPGTDATILRASVERGMAHVPGVASASDIQAAIAAGSTWVKAFPASLLGTAWMSAMRGPFPELTIIATGGVDAQNAPDLLGAGVRIVAVGSALEDPSQLDRLAELTAAVAH